MEMGRGEYPSESRSVKVRIGSELGEVLGYVSGAVESIWILLIHTPPALLWAPR